MHLPGFDPLIPSRRLLQVAASDAPASSCAKSPGQFVAAGAVLTVFVVCVIMLVVMKMLVKGDAAAAVPEEQADRALPAASEVVMMEGARLVVLAGEDARVVAAVPCSLQRPPNDLLIAFTATNDYKKIFTSLAGTEHILS